MADQSQQQRLYQSQIEHLQAKVPGTGHADQPKQYVVRVGKRWSR